MEYREFDNFINDFCKIESIQAIALGGSISTGRADDKSDYDFYVYYDKELDSESRSKILSKYCKYFELGNTFFELEDSGKFNWDIEFDIIYRNIYSFTDKIMDVVENFNSYNGFTTCFWHNLLHSKIIYDKDSIFEKLQKRFSVTYPQKLKENIIKRNMSLLSDSTISYYKDIIKSIYRNDLVNTNNRISVFLASYFDIIFAVNELPNPGEKRLMEICLANCNLLPKDFKQNIDKLIINMDNFIIIEKVLNSMIYELKKCCNGLTST